MSLRGGTHSKVNIAISWEHNGELGYAEVRKYIGPKTDKAVSLLKSANATIIEKQVSFDRCRFEAEFVLTKSDLNKRLSDIAKAVEDVFTALKFS